MGEDEPLSRELDAKVQLYARLIMSCKDFSRAAQLARYLLQTKVHEREDDQSQMLSEAVNCAMVIAYTRPFSRNNPERQGLPDRFLRGFTPRQLAVHQVAIADRDTRLAHSDASAWHMRPTVVTLRNHKLVVSTHGNTQAAMDPKIIAIFADMATALKAATLEEARHLESELLEVFEARTRRRNAEAARTASLTVPIEPAAVILPPPRSDSRPRES